MSYNPVVIWQDSSDATLFRGKLDLDTSYIGSGWTVFIKGPVHLQRRFDNLIIAKDTELNLTAKPLLPGDLQLPQSGQNDHVDYDENHCDERHSTSWKIVIKRNHRIFCII